MLADLLDSLQAEIANSHASCRQVVIAGPGAGKTTTAGAMIEELDSQFDDAENRNVLFISFSRAAVKSVLDSHFDALNDLDISIDARTIDSLAAAIIDTEFEFDDAEQPNFEGRLAKAIAVLRSDSSDSTMYLTPLDIENLDHVIIDEAQDVLGLRREFVLALLKRIPETCGVTIFGDPAQSIYGFRDDADGNEGRVGLPGASWNSFMEDLSEIFAFETRFLEGNYRSQTSRMRRIGSALAETRSSLHSESWTIELDRIQSEELNRVSIDALGNSVSRWKGSTAVLTRTNAEAIQLYGRLKSEHIMVNLNLRPELRSRAPRWPGIWAREAGTHFTSTELRGFLLDSGFDVAQCSDEIGIELDFDTDLTWDEVEACSLRNYEATVSKNAAVPVISTVHQSKGLEYDNVVIHRPQQYVVHDHHGNTDPELLFVAMTRARRRTVALEGKLPRTQKNAGRLVIPSPNRRRFSPEAIAVLPTDIDRRLPMSGVEGQLALAAVDNFATLEFERIKGSVNYPVYRCLIDGIAVGVTNEAFGKALIKFCGSGSKMTLSPVPLDGVESVFGITQDESKSSWLVPRPVGFSAISF